MEVDTDDEALDELVDTDEDEDAKVDDPLEAEKKVVEFVLLLLLLLLGVEDALVDEGMKEEENGASCAEADDVNVELVVFAASGSGVGDITGGMK
jgi:hypothetical protein